MTSIKLLNGRPFIPYKPPVYQPSELISRSLNFYNEIHTRRSCRSFSEKSVPSIVIENILLAASSAPSGANKQPWTFCVVSDPAIKQRIRREAEAEEEKGYMHQMNEELRQNIAPLGTDWQKEFLEIAPYLIVMFRRSYEVDEAGNKQYNYHVHESCGIAAGFLLAAIHMAGLSALTYTPSPMDFLTPLLERPENEKPFMIVPIGYPSDDCWVPDLKRKDLEEFTAWY